MGLASTRRHAHRSRAEARSTTRGSPRLRRSARSLEDEVKQELMRARRRASDGRRDRPGASPLCRHRQRAAHPDRQPARHAGFVRDRASDSASASSARRRTSRSRRSRSRRRGGGEPIVEPERRRAGGRAAAEPHSTTRLFTGGAWHDGAGLLARRPCAGPSHRRPRPDHRGSSDRRGRARMGGAGHRAQSSPARARRQAARGARRQARPTR